MKRRRILQAGLTLATLPLASCAEAPPPPVSAPPAPPPTPAPAASAPPASPATPTAEPSAAPAPQPPPAAKPALERVVAKVGTNHGHVFLVGMADVKAGVEKTYDLTGSASHAHKVTLTAEHFAKIGAGEIVRLPSTRDGHLHRLLVKLAPAVDPPELANVCEITIGGKDDHELVVTAADLTGKRDRDYDIQGVAPHGHALKITAADFETLQRGQQLSLRTGPAIPDADHGHVVFIRYHAKPA